MRILLRIASGAVLVLAAAPAGVAAQGPGNGQAPSARTAACASALPCADRIRQLAETPARPARIERPTKNGRLVDWCMERNPDWACGAPVAHLVCREAGYRRAAAYAVAKAGGRTWVVGANRLTAGPCQGPQCRGFDYVACER